MIEPSESARRIESTLRRFGVELDGTLGGKEIAALTSKKGFGMVLPAFVERFQTELEAAEVPGTAGKMLKLRLKQMDEVATELQAAPANDRFEASELAMLASFLDLSVLCLAAALGKDYRAASP